MFNCLGACWYHFFSWDQLNLKVCYGRTRLERRLLQTYELRSFTQSSATLRYVSVRLEVIARVSGSFRGEVKSKGNCVILKCQCSYRKWKLRIKGCHPKSVPFDCQYLDIDQRLLHHSVENLVECGKLVRFSFCEKMLGILFALKVPQNSRAKWTVPVFTEEV